MLIRKHSLRQWFLVTIATVGISSPASLAAQQGGGGLPRQQEGVEPEVEIPAASRVLNRTYFKTVNGVFLALNTTFVNAFSDTVVLCPGTTPCTIAVTVSSQFGSVTAGQVARARVFVNGLLTHPGDACCLNMSPNESPRPQTATMTFVARNVPPGNRIVRVQFSVSGGAGYADFRSLEIGVYKP
jgi:hypothetical protein